MHVLADPSEMRDWSRAERARGRRIGFVPTMGFLHEGPLRLVDRGRERADRVVMSSFVNPLQFGAGEDFTSYPRDLDRDQKLASARGVDCLFLPDVKAMYPADPLVRIHPGPMAEGLEGAARPGHFAGVLTVVAKLFHLVERSEEHTSELQSQSNLVCRLLLEKKKKNECHRVLSAQ